MTKMCYKIFNIPGYGESHEIRSTLCKELDDYLSMHIDRLETDTILISNEQQYFDFNDKYSLLKPKFECKWGELGIWASNLLAITNFLKTDYEYLMLIEDDIIVKNKQFFLDYLSESMNNLPDNWDVFSYFAPKNQFSRFTNLHETSDITVAYQDWSMLCYILNRSSAEKFLKRYAQIGIDKPIDHYIFRHPEIFNTYTLSPHAKRPCELYETVSTFQLKELPIEVPKKRGVVMTRTLSEKLPNWFLGNKTQEDFSRLLSEFKDKPNLKFLEIGSFCGNSAAWTLQNILTDKTSSLTCVDPWNGNVLHEAFDFSDVEAAFDQQLEPFKAQLIKQKAYSDVWLMSNRSIMYDFIYIDGDHMPQAFMSDALLSWELLKPGGIMAIDDYAWTHPRGSKYNPKGAIDMFVSMYSEHLEVIEKGWQVWIRKDINYVRPEHIHE